MYKLLVFALLIAGAGEPIRHVSPYTAMWTTPAVLLAAMLIAWAAESAQFFIAQGFALAILAWIQTLPEFAVEAVLAWHQQVPFLMANLTGALRLLTGLGWPMIYFTAAFVHRRRTGKPLRNIELDAMQSVQVVGLLPPLAYMGLVWWKSTLHVYDAIVLTAMYAAYLLVLGKMPPEGEEGIEDLERIPRAVVRSPKLQRNLWITVLFASGALLIYYMAEPFLASLMALSVVAGIPSFVFIQWVAPFVSEFPEKISAFYWARTVTRAPMALMNMVSSNINQWTLLVAMLPIVYSFSRGAATGIPLDPQQELELLMTIGQSLLGMLFLVNMQLAWWEAGGLFLLWAVQFGFSAAAVGSDIHWWITVAYYVWAAWEIVRIIAGGRKPAAFRDFGHLWATHVSRVR